ncbi:MAG: (d)CMP kinase [Acidobacteriota bacterium]
MNPTPSSGGDGPMVVAIDGPSGVGKSTCARLLAEQLGLPVLDTGAMYRAVALAMVQRGVDPTDGAAVERELGDVQVELRADGRGGLEVWLDGEPVGDRIRAPEVTEASSKVSVHPAVRRRMVAYQRQGASVHGAVVEGRDIGSVVFPDTPFKFFLGADPEVRTQRRFRQLAETGRGVDRDRVRADLELRDARDRDRVESPLVCDDTYHFIDTSGLESSEVVAEMARAVAARRAAERASGSG